MKGFGLSQRRMTNEGGGGVRQGGLCSGSLVVGVHDYTGSSHLYSLTRVDPAFGRVIGDLNGRSLRLRVFHFTRKSSD